MHQFSEIAIAPNSFFMMLRSSISFSKFLLKLLTLTWNTENEFSRNLYTPCPSPPVRCTLVAFPRIRKFTLLKYSLLKMYCWTFNLKKFSLNTIFRWYTFGTFCIVKFNYFSGRPNKVKEKFWNIFDWTLLLVSTKIIIVSVSLTAY